MRTVNRKAWTVGVISEDDMGYKYFNHYNWKGLYDDKNFLGVDQESFEYCMNVYVDSEGLLCSRPSLKKNNVLPAIGSITRVETFPGINVFVQNVEDKYVLYFVDAATNIVKAQKSVSNYKLVLADNKIFIFQTNQLEYFDLNDQDKGILSGANKIYVPDTEESPNILTTATSEHITYTGPDDDNKLANLAGKDVTITIDGNEYKRTFIQGMQKGFLSKMEELTAEEAKHVIVKGTSVITYSWLPANRTYRIRYKVGASAWTTVETPSLPVGDSYIAGKPSLSEDGYHINYAIFANRIWNVYCLSIVATGTSGTKTWSSWSYDNPVVYLNFNTGEVSFSNRENISLQVYMPDDSAMYFVCNTAATLEATPATSYRYLCGLYTVKWTTTDGIKATKTFDAIEGEFAYEGGNTYKLNAAGGYAFVINGGSFYIVSWQSLTITGAKPTHTINRLIVLRKSSLAADCFNIFLDESNPIYLGISVVDDGDAYDYSLEDYSIHFVTSGSNEYLDVYGPVRQSWTSYTRARFTLTNTRIGNNNPGQGNICQASAQFVVLPTLISKQDDGDIRYKPVRALANESFDSKTYITNDSLVYNTGSTEVQIVTTPGAGENAFYSEYFARPVAIIDTTHCYYVTNAADKYYLYSTYPVETIAIDVLNEGASNFVVPDFVTQLDGYFFAFGKEVYISKIGAKADVDNFQWYIPKNQTQNFPEPILNMHAISSTDVAIFFENSIYYITKGEGNYYINKSKIPLGLKKGSDIVTSYDGKYTIFSTSRGLVAMAYQDFVASTEQALTYLSDNIFSAYDKWNVSPIKLCQYKFWLICYRTDNKTAYIYDMRNASWWPVTVPDFVNEVTELDYKLAVISDGKILNCDIGTTDYKDYGTEVIDWEVRSQKLHFNASNFYKHICSVTFNAVTDNNNKFTFKMRATNYRKLVSEKQPETLEYKVDVIRTFVKRFNFAKVSEFQYSLYNNNEDARPQPFAITNLSVKFKITGNAR